MEESYNKKRINPPFWQHDYHVLKRLYKSLEVIANKHLKRKVDLIVDYGCGSMPYKDLFSLRASKYTGVDIGENRKADILVGENQKIPLKGASVDVILSTQVLEHVKSSDYYLLECRRLLKKNGLLILSTHGIWPYHAFPADFHRWTKQGLIYEVEKSGFRVLDIFSVLQSFACMTQFEILLIAERLINRGFVERFLLAFISLLSNLIIYIEDKIFPEEESNSSLYIICARKK